MPSPSCPRPLHQPSESRLSQSLNKGNLIAEHGTVTNYQNWLLSCKPHIPRSKCASLGMSTRHLVSHQLQRFPSQFPTGTALEIITGGMSVTTDLQKFQRMKVISGWVVYPTKLRPVRWARRRDESARPGTTTKTTTSSMPEIQPDISMLLQRKTALSIVDH